MSATGEAIGQARLFGLLRGAARPPGRRGARPVRRRGPPLGRPLDARVPLLAGARPARRAPARSSAPTAATSCTAATRCARSWPRRSAARSCERLEVGAFSQAELAEQVAGILGDAAGRRDLVARLHARCEGNAFFAEELLAASDAAAGPLPSNLRDVLNLRLEALPDDARGGAARGRRGRPARRATPARGGRRRCPSRALVEALREAVAQHVLVQDARRLRLPPRAAAGGRLRRPAPRRADRAAPGARRGAARRPQPRPTGRPRPSSR